MSANNQLVITKKDGKFNIHNIDVDGCGSYLITKKCFETLESTVEYSNEYMRVEEVEYGLRIAI